MIGVVQSGFGACQRDVRNGVYSADLLGFEPWPGSLNLKIEQGALVTLGEPDLIIAGPECPLWMWNAVAKIQKRRCTLEVGVLLMHPDRYPPVDVTELVEVFAPVGFRHQFGVADGDHVEVLR